METIKHRPHPVGETAKPIKFCLSSKVFTIEDFKGVTADTIRKRLAKEGIKVSAAWANAFHARINKTKKED